MTLGLDRFKNFFIVSTEHSKHFCIVCWIFLFLGFHTKLNLSFFFVCFCAKCYICGLLLIFIVYMQLRLKIYYSLNEWDLFHSYQ